MSQVMQYVDEVPDAPYDIRVYCGTDAAFTLYEDAGDGYDYERGAFAVVELKWSEERRELTISERQGFFPELVKEREYRFIFISKSGNEEHSLRYSGQEVLVRGFR
jgi:alpha-D-xyloside xylohydrolase